MGHIVSTPMDSPIFFKPAYSIPCNFIGKDQKSSIKPQESISVQHGRRLTRINFASAFTL